MTLDLLFPNFDELIRKPEDVQRLNEAILQLAVQGKLVAQDPNDEPAGELLKRIESDRQLRQEMAQAVRTRGTRSVRQDERPFDLPAGWAWARVDEIGEVRLGRQRSPEHHFGDHMRYYVRAANVTWDGLDLSNVKQMNFTPGVFEAYQLQQNDILLNEASGSPSEVGKAVIWRNEIPDCCFQNTLIRVRLYDLWPDYVRLYFESLARTGRFGRTSQGIGINHLGADRLAREMVALPPLPEQQRIVAKVNELFAQTRTLAAKLRQAQEDVVTVNRAALHRLHTAQDEDQFQASWRTIRDHFDVLYDDPRNVAELRQSILDLAVRGKLVAQDPNDEPAEELLKRIEAKKKSLVNEGRIKRSSALLRNGSDMPYDLPEGWTWALVDGLCYVGTGSTPRRDEPDNYEDGQIPWITSAVTGMPFITEASEYISERALAETNCQVYPKHTLIVGMYGQGKTRGQVSELLIEASTNQACAALVFDGFSDCVRPYVKLFFQKNYLELRKLAEGGAQPNLNVGKIRTTSLPVPPFAEQQRIVAKVDQLMRLCDELEAGLAQAESQRRNLTAAMLQTG